MKRARFIGGLILMCAAAVTFMGPWDTPTSASIALLVVGIALVATSRRMR